MSGPERRLTSVILLPRAADAITAAASGSADGNETGGILLGALHADGTAVVRRAGGPGPVAVRTPVFFLRDLGHAQRLAAEEFTVSGSVWIGDWHTHPCSALVPSSRDLATYAGLLTDPDLSFPAFLTLIVDPGPLGWEQPRMAGWACQDGHAIRVPVSVLDGDHQPEPPAPPKGSP
jgi:integrative and conjugative element protein (TIGR02256 family)